MIGKQNMGNKTILNYTYWKYSDKSWRYWNDNKYVMIWNMQDNIKSDHSVLMHAMSVKQNDNTMKWTQDMLIWCNRP